MPYGLCLSCMSSGSASLLISTGCRPMSPCPVSHEACVSSSWPVDLLPGADRSFVSFILEPLYKITSTVIAEHPKVAESAIAKDFGVYLKSSSWQQDVKPLLKEVGGVK